MTPLELLREQFNHHVRFQEKRPGVLQLFAPLFHEDGDMIDVFLDLPKGGSLENKIRITDHGLTLMRLSYSFDIDTPNKQTIFSRILAENGVLEENGELYMYASQDELYPALLQFSQAVSKVCNMRYFRREVLASLFDEMLAEYIQSELIRFHPENNVLPIPDRDELQVDWALHANATPVYLFAIKDVNRARLATISCLEFQRSHLKFKSVAVHEDIDKISRKDRNRLTNACDKQFTSFEEFKANAVAYLEREAA